MKIVGIAVATAAMLATVSATAQAQGEQRKGFFTAAGIGYGATHFTCSACASSRDGGVSIYIDLGAGVSRSVILGGELAAWWREQSGQSLWISNVLFYGQVYPSAGSGFFLKGGLGWSHAEGLYAVSVGPNFKTFDGVGYMGAVGWDFSSGEDFTFTATLGTFGGVFSDSNPVTSPGANVIQLLVGVTFF